MLADGHALPNQTQLRPPPSWPSGVEVTAVCYDGMIHAFGPLNALCQVPGMRSALLHASEELRKRLGGRAPHAHGVSRRIPRASLGRLFVLTQPY